MGYILAARQNIQRVQIGPRAFFAILLEVFADNLLRQLHVQFFKVERTRLLCAPQLLEGTQKGYRVGEKSHPLPF